MIEEPVILALDQASHTGWAVATETGNILKSGTQTFKGTQGARFSNFRTWLYDMINEHHPVVLAHEIPHFRGYAATLIGVGLVAMIHAVGYDFNIPVFGVHTAQLKKFATGKGKATKSNMTEAASDIIGSSLSAKENNDEADAIHIARYCASNWRSESNG